MEAINVTYLTSDPTVDTEAMENTTRLDAVAPTLPTNDITRLE